MEELVLCVILEKGLCFVQVWGDQKEVVHQSHQTSTRHTERKITFTVNRKGLQSRKSAICCCRCVVTPIEVDVDCNT